MKIITNVLLETFPSNFLLEKIAVFLRMKNKSPNK